MGGQSLTSQLLLTTYLLLAHKCRVIPNQAMADPVLPSLRGKVLAKPEKVKWRPQVDDDIRKVEYAYSYERGTQPWTPLNSNMHMQGIKVVTHVPVPKEVIKGGRDATETTLTILEIIKEKKRKENRAKKEEMIQQMAMELKMKRENKQRATWL